MRRDREYGEKRSDWSAESSLETLLKPFTKACENCYEFGR